MLDVFDAFAAFTVPPGVILDAVTGAASAASTCESAELSCGRTSGTVGAPAGFACLPAAVSCCADCAKQVVLAAGAISKKELNTYLHHPRVIPRSLDLIVGSNERRGRDRRRHLCRQEHRLPLYAAADGLLRNYDRVARTQFRVKRISTPQPLVRTQDRAIRANHKNCLLIG